MPPGATPPLVISYSASSIPVIQLGLSSTRESEQALNDTALNFLRSQLVTILGAAVPYPYGGKTRLISVDLDTRALLAKGLTPTGPSTRKTSSCRPAPRRSARRNTRST